MKQIQSLYEIIIKIRNNYNSNNVTFKELLNDIKSNDFFKLLPLKENNGYMIFDSTQNYQHRYYAYYDLRKNKNDNENLLTFIMYNPSTADTEKEDSTIKNCKCVAQKYKYNAIEILNLYSFINSKPTNKDTNNNEINEIFIKEFIDKKENVDIVIAWGFGKEKNFDSCYIENIKNLILKKESFNKYIVNVKNNKINELKNKNLHPANSTWSLFGGCQKAAMLKKI